MSKCCKGKCWCKFLPHNWLCLKGLYVAFIVLFYFTLVSAIVAACFLCGQVWNMFTTYFAQAGAKELLMMSAFWKALFVVLLQVVVVSVPLMLSWLAFAKLLKVAAKIKQAVAPCECDAKKETKKEVKEAK